MSEKHTYAPIYEKYLGLIKDIHKPAISETGILSCTGVAMWTHLYKGSKVFGFDLNTTTCLSNFPKLREKGFDDTSVVITDMDQLADADVNHGVIKKALGETRLNIAIDDGYHYLPANVETFKQFLPFMDQRFVYFIEDVQPKKFDDNEIDEAIADIAAACPKCSVKSEHPEDYANDKDTKKKERIVVVTRK